MMRKNTAKLRVGRLLEIRADAGYRTREDVEVLFDAIDREVQAMPPRQRHVTVVDWRRCPLMSPEAAAHIAFRITGTNQRTERSAALASESAPVTVLQFLRVIREAGLSDRKLFFEPDALVEWLAEILSPEETKRLRAFLLEVPED